MPAIFIRKLLSALCIALSLSSYAMAGALLQESLVLPTAQGPLHASVIRPKTAQATPVALLVPGSGPTDRDGNSAYGLKTDSLKRLARTLSAMGVASVRYDKRGVGQSLQVAPNEVSLRAEAFVDDISGWVRLLKQDQRFSRVIVIGHSEGGLFASLAAIETPMDALILIAASGRPVAQTLALQLDKQPLPEPLAAESRTILRALEQGQLVETVDQALWPLFRPSVQPYLRSLFAYDPVYALAKSHMPVLIIQGDQDVQVSVDDAKRLASARENTELAIIPGMNHVLRIIKNSSAQLASYNQPERPLAYELGQRIESFLATQGILPPSSSPETGR